MLKIRYIEFILFIIYLSFILCGFKEFIIWSQITDILLENATESNILELLNMILVQHPHIMRVFLMFPIYVISEYLMIDLNTLFSIIVLICIFSIYYINAIILKSYMVYKKSLILILILLIGLSFVMNGRIVFAMLGNTLLLYILHINFYSIKKLKKYKILLLFLFSFWLSSVSSGTFSVFILTVGVFYFILFLVNLPYVNKKIILQVASFIVFLITISSMIMIFVEKNLSFYGGSVLNVLDHGIGKYLIDYFFIIFPLFVALVLFLPMVILYLKKYQSLILPLSMMISSFTIGLFGFSSLASGLSAYLLFIYMFLNRVKRLQNV